MLDGKKFEGVAYQEQEEVYFDDGREIALLKYIYARPDLPKLRNNPQAILDAIDEYGRTQKYLMNVGAYKSGTVVDLIRDVRPAVMVELGGYVGYSAIAFGAALKEAGGREYWSLESSPEFGAVIGSLVDLAGLRDLVRVEVGNSDASLRRLHAEGKVRKIDLMFIDHWKPAYVTDLKLCEELGLVGPGSVLAADNVVKPGNPPYLEYVRSSIAEKRAKAKAQTHGEASDFDAQHRKAHERSRDVPDDMSGVKVRGNPDLIYESKFVEGWEPSGVPDAIEITRCVGVEKATA